MRKPRVCKFAYRFVHHFNFVAVQWGLPETIYTRWGYPTALSLWVPQNVGSEVTTVNGVLLACFSA